MSDPSTWAAGVLKDELARLHNLEEGLGKLPVVFTQEDGVLTGRIEVAVGLEVEPGAEEACRAQVQQAIGQAIYIQAMRAAGFL